MAKNEKTSKRVGKVASKGLRTGLLSKQQIKTLSGSTLAQLPDRRRGVMNGLLPKKGK